MDKILNKGGTVAEGSISEKEVFVTKGCHDVKNNIFMHLIMYSYCLISLNNSEKITFY